VSAPKVAVLVLVLLAVLFAIGLGAGLFRGDGGPPSDPADTPLAKALGGWVGPPPAVAAAEWQKHPPVGGAFLVPAVGECVAEVASSDARSRQFVLVTSGPCEVKVTWEPTPDPNRPSWMPDDAIRVSVTLRPSGKPPDKPREVKFQVPAKGGKLTLTLVNGKADELKLELVGGKPVQRVQVKGG
jgi:hypothetical protein